MLRALSILLLALCVLPTWSWDFCQKNKDGEMLYYNFYDDDFQMCEVAYNKDAQYTGKFDTLWIPDVVILPAEYEGRDEDTVLAVVGIEPHTFEHAAFQHVHIPETVSEIGEYAFAFSDCIELDSVTITARIANQIGHHAACFLPSEVGILKFCVADMCAKYGEKHRNQGFAHVF
jgi:hypothetical protein